MLVFYSYAAGTNIMSSFEYINGTKIIKIRFKLLNDVLIRTENINPTDLEIMIKCHITLNELITNMNKIYGSRQLSSITNDFVIIIVQLYSFFVSIDNSFHDGLYVKFIFKSLMMPTLITKIYFTAMNCQQVLSNKTDFGKLLRRFENSKISEEVSHLVYKMLNI